MTPDARRAAVADRLARLGCVAADDEAALLLADDPDEDAVEDRVRRRATGEPPAWIVGRTPFAGQLLHIEAGVYVPRPATEELARRAAAGLPEGGVIVDLACGCGAVGAVVAATGRAHAVVGVDVDPLAVACARRNGVAAVVGDLASPPLRAEIADVVTVVAPYVPTGALALLPPDVVRHEPRAALDGGPDGLVHVGRALVTAARLLRPGGWFLAEVGGDQLASVAVALVASGFDEPEPWDDEEGDLRGVAARLRSARP